MTNSIGDNETNFREVILVITDLSPEPYEPTFFSVFNSNMFRLVSYIFLKPLIIWSKAEHIFAFISSTLCANCRLTSQQHSQLMLEYLKSSNP